MIIDAILDRRANIRDYGVDSYDLEGLKYMYDEAMDFSLFELASAIDGGTEKQLKQALCHYIDEQKYNPEIKDFVCSVNWVIE